MIYTVQTKKALKLCFEAHRDQVDKSGMPYVFHPFHLAEQMTDEDSTVAALLHDVVEDTDYTPEDLRQMGFAPRVVEALALLTHGDGEPYLRYVGRLRENPIARAVKLADLAHNSDLSRMDTVSEKDLRRMLKYKMAQAVLEPETPDLACGCCRKRIPLDLRGEYRLSVYYEGDRVLRYSLDREGEEDSCRIFAVEEGERLRAMLPPAGSLPEALAEYLAAHRGEVSAALAAQLGL